MIYLLAINTLLLLVVIAQRQTKNSTLKRIEQKIDALGDPEYLRALATKLRGPREELENAIESNQPK